LTTTSDTRRRRLSALAVVAIAVLGGFAASGCGDDDDDTATPAATTGAETTAGADTTAETQGGNGGTSTIDLSMTDFELNPSDPTVPAGEVTINATNDGQAPHNIEVEGPSGEQELESDLSPGDSGTLTVDLSKPGNYEWYCPVGNHRDLGMEGEITVE
jgi:uncharacterized cupredoxin-like copper-binding protein